MNNCLNCKWDYQDVCVCDKSPYCADFVNEYMICNKFEEKKNMHYIYIENDKINGCGQCQCTNALNVEVTKEIYDDFVENPDKYLNQNGEIVLNPNYEAQQLIQAKQNKQQENLNKANEAVLKGYVTYKGCQFETNTDNQSNMTATANLMQAQGLEATQWLSKDNIPIELTLEDFLNIGGLILNYKTNLWTNVYAGFEAQIEAAQNIEDVENIVITYENQED